MPDLSITFTNWSRTTFTLVPGSLSSKDDGTITFNQFPDNTLNPNLSQTLSVSNWSSLLIGTFDIWCLWSTETSKFGVKIHVPGQILDIGTEPYWYIFYQDPQTPDQDMPGVNFTYIDSYGESNIPWILPANDPAQSYAWPEEVGYLIKADPVAAHQGLSITVTIDDLPSPVPLRAHAGHGIGGRADQVEKS